MARRYSRECRDSPARVVGSASWWARTHAAATAHSGGSGRGAAEPRVVVSRTASTGARIRFRIVHLLAAGPTRQRRQSSTDALSLGNRVVTVTIRWLVRAVKQARRNLRE